jgi:hypothetical protein
MCEFEPERRPYRYRFEGGLSGTLENATILRCANCAAESVAIHAGEDRAGMRVMPSSAQTAFPRDRFQATRVRLLAVAIRFAWQLAAPPAGVVSSGFSTNRPNSLV